MPGGVCITWEHDDGGLGVHLRLGTPVFFGLCRQVDDGLQNAKDILQRTMVD